MCRAMKVSRSGYHSWLHRSESHRGRANRRLDALIKAEFTLSKKRSGSHKITEALKQKGEKTYRTKVAKRMKEMELRSRTKKKFRVTTDSKRKEPVAPNLLDRQYRVSAPNKVWVSDFTYLWTQHGWVYLTVIIDLFSRIVVGWAVSTSLSADAVIKAFWRAVGRRCPEAELFSKVVFR
jgi:transposase InsO family protein